MARLAKQPFKDSPYTIFNSIAPGASAISPRPRAIYVQFGGDLEIEDDDGDTTILGDVLGGAIIPISPVKILSGSTTATGIIGCN